ncbi:MAG: YCF48-related protein, partial [FCB group bacterium]
SQAWINKSLPDTRAILSMLMTDSTTGWLAGINGLFYKTTDGAKIWQDKTMDTNHILQNLIFTDAKHGWIQEVSRTGPNLLYTTDTGNNWLPGSLANAEEVGTIFFIDSSNGFFAGVYFIPSSSSLFRTNDGGKNWTDLVLNYSSWITCYSVVDSNNFWLAGENGLLVNSKDGGKTWSQINSNLRDNITLIHFFSQNSGIVTCDSLIYLTNDGGNNWNRANSFPNINYISGMQFINKNIGWLSCFTNSNKGTILYTNNGGEDWIQLNIVGEYGFDNVYFIDENHGWAMGENGSLFYTKTGGFETAVKENNLNINIKIINYNGIVTINLLDDSNNNIISLYDIFGELIFKQNIENKNEFSFDFSHFTIGTYLININNINNNKISNYIIQNY